MALGWAKYWLKDRNPPHGFQLRRSVVKDEATVSPIFVGVTSISPTMIRKVRRWWTARWQVTLLPMRRSATSHPSTQARTDLPPNLKDFVILALRSRAAACPPRKKGGDPYANVARDMFIVGALSWLARLGFSPTRNEATDKPTGSSILAEALQQLGFDIDYAGVAKVWGSETSLTPLLRGTR